MICVFFANAERPCGFTHRPSHCARIWAARSKLSIKLLLALGAAECFSLRLTADWR